MSGLSETSSSMGDWEQFNDSDSSHELMRKLEKIEEEMKKMKLEMEKKEKENALLLSKVNESVKAEVAMLREEMKKMKEEFENGGEPRTQKSKKKKPHGIWIAWSEERKERERSRAMGLLKQITCKEDQLISSMKRHKDNAAELLVVLDECYKFYRYGNIYAQTRGEEAVNLVMNALERHPKEKYIQIKGSACMYYTLRSAMRNMNKQSKQLTVSLMMSEEKRGVPLLKELASDPLSSNETRKLAKHALRNVEKAKNQAAHGVREDTKQNGQQAPSGASTSA